MLNPIRRPSHRYAVIGAVVAALSLLSACGGNSDENETGSAGGTFTLRIAGAPTSLDVPKNFLLDNTQFIALANQKLETLSVAGEPSPGLATNVSQPDPKTLVYTIRSGVKFSDGTPLTATDVAWSITHAATGTSQEAGLFPWLQSATATNPTTVTVKLKEPNSQARTIIDVLIFVQEAKFGQAHATSLGSPSALPVGTGPYMFSGSTPQAITMTRNPYFTGTKPLPDKIVVTPISDENSAQLALRSGSVSSYSVTNLRTIDTYKKIKGVSLTTAEPATSLSYIALNTKVAPFDDVHVRRAIAYSFDAKGVMTASAGANFVLTSAMTLPGEFATVASEADAKAFVNSLPAYALDVAKAKAELAQSKVPNGFQFDLEYSSADPLQKIVALTLQQNLAKIDVTATPKPVTATQWGTDIYSHKNAITLTSITSLSPDPFWRLTNATNAANLSQGGFNTGQYTRPDVEKADAVLLESSDRSTRWTATQTILKAIADDVPYIPIGATDYVVATGGGWSFGTPPTRFDLLYNGTWISDLKRQ